MPKITMYSSASCSFCVAAERLLERRGVRDIEKIRVDQDPQSRLEMEERTQRRTVPQIFIGDTYIGGYSELAVLERSGELERLLVGG